MRSQNRIDKPKQLLDGIDRYPPLQALTASLDSKEVEPFFTTTNKLAEWRRAMNEEFDALLKNSLWHLTPPSSSTNIIGTMWEFCIKWKVDRSIDRYKAGLVVKNSIHNQESTL